MVIISAGFATIKAYQANLLQGMAIPDASAHTTAGSTLLDLTASLAAYKNTLARPNITEPPINNQTGPGEKAAHTSTGLSCCSGARMPELLLALRKFDIFVLFVLRSSILHAGTPA